MARGEGEREREREGARARVASRRLIGQEIKLGLGEMGKWEAEEEGEAEKEGGERAGARMHTNTQFPTLVLIRRTLLLPLPLLPFLSLTHFLFFTARADSHAQPVGGWFHSFRLPLPVVIEVPLRQVAAVVLELERPDDPPPPALSRCRSRC